jgi:hypothetical protein
MPPPYRGEGPRGPLAYPFELEPCDHDTLFSLTVQAKWVEWRLCSDCGDVTDQKT